MGAKTLTPRQRKAIKARAEGKTLDQCAKEAGYANAANVAAALKKTSANEALRAALEKAGLTDEKIAEKLVELMDATKLVGKNADVQAPDNQAQVAATDLAVKVKGAYAPTKTEVTGKDGKPFTVIHKPLTARELAEALTSLGKPGK